MTNETEKNIYTLESFKSEGPDQTITFYKMNEDGSFEHGTTLEEMISVTTTRLAALNAKFPCMENEKAITSLKTASKWLDARTQDRTTRGVEGKHLE